MMAWVLSVLAIWFWPTALSVYNPFLAPIAKAIQNRQYTTACWGACCSGLARDMILFSPKFGLLCFSSLAVCALVYRLCRLLSLDGWQGSFVVAILAIVQYIADTFACAVTSSLEQGGTTSWSWRGYALFVSLSCLWAILLGLVHAMRRFSTVWLSRRTS